MESEPVTDIRFVAHEQGSEAIKQGVGVFDDGASAVEFGVKKRVVVGLPVGRVAAAS